MCQRSIQLNSMVSTLRKTRTKSTRRLIISKFHCNKSNCTFATDARRDPAWEQCSWTPVQFQFKSNYDSYRTQRPPTCAVFSPILSHRVYDCGCFWSHFLFIRSRVYFQFAVLTVRYVHCLRRGLGFGIFQLYSIFFFCGT